MVGVFCEFIWDGGRVWIKDPGDVLQVLQVLQVLHMCGTCLFLYSFNPPCRSSPRLLSSRTSSPASRA